MSPYILKVLTGTDVVKSATRFCRCGDNDICKLFFPLPIEIFGRSATHATRSVKQTISSVRLHNITDVVFGSVLISPSFCKFLTEGFKGQRCRRWRFLYFQSSIHFSFILYKGKYQVTNIWLQQQGNLSEKSLMLYTY